MEEERLVFHFPRGSPRFFSGKVAQDKHTAYVTKLEQRIIQLERNLAALKAKNSISKNKNAFSNPKSNFKGQISTQEEYTAPVSHNSDKTVQYLLDFIDHFCNSSNDLQEILINLKEAGIDLESSACILSNKTAIKSLSNEVNRHKYPEYESNQVLEDICDELNCKQGNALDKIRRMKAKARTSKVTLKFAESVVSHVTNTLSRYCRTTNSSKCITRIDQWLLNPDSETDVLQEIDFLIGIAVNESRSKNAFEI